MNNVTLIGMPGSGKSTIGVILAKALRYEFLDSDLLIQKQEKRKLSEIIEQDGPEKFKEIENQVNADIHVTDTVIAPGDDLVVHADGSTDGFLEDCLIHRWNNLPVDGIGGVF